MITTIHSNLLNETTGIIVHGCSAQGVMASGIAKSIKERYPQVYYDYTKHCSFMRRMDPGNLLGSVVFTPITSQLIFISAITQEFYGRDENVCYVSYNAIETAFEAINKIARSAKLQVKFPMIGAGLAGGDWNTISNIIDKTVQSTEKFLFIKQ